MRWPKRRLQQSGIQSRHQPAAQLRAEYLPPGSRPTHTDTLPAGRRHQNRQVPNHQPIDSDQNAFTSGYIEVPNGQGKVYSPSQEAGYAEYTFNVPSAGDYVIWGRIIAKYKKD